MKQAPGATGRSDGTRRAALISATVALLLRIVYLLEGSGNPFWRHLGLDTAAYDEWARAVIHGHGLGQAPFTQAPLFPLLLAASYAIVGPSPVRALWMHLLPGTAAVLLVAWTAGRWRGASAAWVAGLLLALYKPAIFYTGVLLPPTWTLFLAALCLWATLRAAEERAGTVAGASPGRGRGAPPEGPTRDLVRFGLPGLAHGFLALAQPAAFVAVLPAAWWLRRTTPARRCWPGLALGAALPIFCTFLYNGLAGQAWTPVAVNGGINLYIGNGPEANGAYVRPPGMREDRDLLGIEAARTLAGGGGSEGALQPTGGSTVRPAAGRAEFGPAEADRFWRARAGQEMLSHPLRTGSLFLRKLGLFFHQYESPQVESLPFERRYAALLRLPLPGMASLLALALLGALLLWRDDDRAKWLALTAAAMAIGVSLFFVTARFRLAAVPALAVLAGAGAAPWLAAARRRQRSAIAPAAAAVVAGALLALPPAGLNGRAEDGQYLFRLGVIAEKQGDQAEARADYAQALSADPSLGKAEVNLGTLLARQGRLDDARAHLERGVALDPQSAVGFVNLGQIRQIAGDRPGALELYKQALSIDPALLSAQESAALLSYELGLMEDADAALQTVARLAHPGSPSFQRAQTLLSILAGRTSLGEDRWRGCAALRSADLRLAQGDAAGARRLYEDAAAQPAAAAAARQMLERLGTQGTR